MSRQSLGYRYIGVLNKIFKLEDVLGDGNCFFHSLIKSPYINVDCHMQLRRMLVDRVEAELTNRKSGGLVEKLGRICYENDLSKWVQNIKRPGSWAGTCAAVLLCFFLEINICIVTNKLRSFYVVDVRKWMRTKGLYFIREEASTVFLYHHLFRHPFTRSDNCNHFAHMWEIDKSDVESCSIYGSETQSVEEAKKNTDVENNPLDLAGDEPENENDVDDVMGDVSDDPQSRQQLRSAKLKNKQERMKEQLSSAKLKKKQKQTRMMDFLGKMAVNNRQIAELEAERKSVDEWDRELECALCVERLVSSIEVQDAVNSRITVRHVSKGRKEFDWASRSVIIYFYLHPSLGKKDLERSAGLFQVNPRTLEGWLTKEDMKKRWISMVNELSFDDVLRAIPDSSIKKRLQALPIHPRVKKLTVSTKVKGSFRILTKNSSFTKSHQGIVAIANANGSIYVKQGDKRIKRQVNTTKHPQVQDFIRETVVSRWNMGFPISTDELRRLVVKKSRTQNNWEAWSEIYAKGTTQSIKKLGVFLRRAIQKIGYSVRKSTVSQKIPEDWRRLSELGSKRVREAFSEANVDVVLAADETFIRFHETRGFVIGPTGEKRIGTAAQIDDKAGCTVLPTMDMTASRLLAPMVIFTGVFGATLMKKWQTYSDSLVMFTKNHWMTAETFILYIAWLMDHFKGKRIGLIIDYAPSHSNDEMDKWINKLNEEHAVSGTKIFIEWIDKGLTSVYQPGDIAINKPLKDRIRESYHQHLSVIAGEDFQAGQKIKISRETLLGFIEKAFRSINSEQKRTKSIYKSFCMCGLNPWDDKLGLFTQHLDSLSQNKLYATLLKNQEALQL